MVSYITNFVKNVLGYLGLYNKKANLMFLGLDNAMRLLEDKSERRLRARIIKIRHSAKIFRQGSGIKNREGRGKIRQSCFCADKTRSFEMKRNTKADHEPARGFQDFAPRLC